MKEKLFGRGRRGGVLIIAGAVLGAAVAGPGATIAQKAINLTQKDADKRYVKRSEVPAAGVTVETPLNFTATSFTSIANTTIRAPGPGTLILHGSVSAKDPAGGVTATADRLQYRLSAGTTPLTATADAFEVFVPANGDRANGSIDGVALVARKGPIDVQLQAQLATAGTAQIHGRSITAQFVPKAKAVKKKKKKQTDGGGGGGNVGP